MDHAETARSLYDFLNAGDIDGFGGRLTDDFVEHEETLGLAPTKAGVKDFLRTQRAAFPDMQMAAQDVIAGGVKVVVRASHTGTHPGDFMGMPTTGKKTSTCNSYTSFASVATV